MARAEKLRSAMGNIEIREARSRQRAAAEGMIRLGQKNQGHECNYVHRMERAKFLKE